MCACMLLTVRLICYWNYYHVVRSPHKVMQTWSNIQKTVSWMLSYTAAL